MTLPAMPVRSAQDATLNFQQLQRLENQREKSVAITYRTAARNIAASEVVTAIEPDTVVYDPGINLGAKGNYVVPYDGVYQIIGTIAVTVVSKEAYCCALVLKNAVEALRGVRATTAVANQITNVSVSGLLKCVTGDSIELAGFVSGLASALELSERANRLQVFKVA